MQNIYTIVLLLFVPFHLLAQAWERDPEEGVYCLNYQRNGELKGFVQAPDRTAYIITNHREYFSTPGEVYISRIDPKGNISLYKKMDAYFIDGPAVCFNNKFYVLSGTMNNNKRKLNVYDLEWKVNNPVYIPKPDDQQSKISKILVQPDGKIYAFTNGIFCCKSNVVPPSYVYAYDSTGRLLNTLTFPDATITDINSAATGIQVTVITHNGRPWPRNDSLVTLQTGALLNILYSESKKIPQDDDIFSITVLANGSRIWQKGDFVLSPGNGIVFTNSRNETLWEQTRQPGVLYYKPLQLLNGNLVFAVDRYKWEEGFSFNDRGAVTDTLAYEMYTPPGNRRVLINKLSPSINKTSRRNAVYMEGPKNQLWAFYEKSTDAESKLCFMKLSLW